MSDTCARFPYYDGRGVGAKSYIGGSEKQPKSDPIKVIHTPKKTNQKLKIPNSDLSHQSET